VGAFEKVSVLYQFSKAWRTAKPRGLLDISQLPDILFSTSSNLQHAPRPSLYGYCMGRHPFVPPSLTSIPIVMAASGSERNRLCKERKRHGLGPATRGAPRIVTSSPSRATALAAGREYKARSRAVARASESPVLLSGHPDASAQAPSTTVPTTSSTTTVQVQDGPADGPEVEADVLPLVHAVQGLATEMLRAAVDTVPAAGSARVLPGSRPRGSAHALTAPAPPSLCSLDAYMSVFGESRQDLETNMVRTADATMCAERGASVMRASAWTVGGPFELARHALGLEGQGYWTCSLSLHSAEMAKVGAELRALLDAGLATTIFNSTSVRTIANQGRRADRGRGMMPLTPESLATIGGASGLSAAVDAFAGLTCFLSTALGCLFEHRKPVVLVSSPGAKQQLPHTDDTPPFIISDPPPLLGALTAVQPGTRLRIWPGSHRAVLAGKTTGDGPGVLLDVSPLDCLIFRGDIVHCGVRNPSCLPHCRLHMYFVAAGVKETVDLDGTNLLPRWSGRRHHQRW